MISVGSGLRNNMNDAQKFSDERVEEKRSPRLIAIGGGKGGIGKTVMTASMGVGLAALKRDVVVVDADLGGANLHSVMGIEKPARTFFNFINGEYGTLDEIMVEYPHSENLHVICGASGSAGVAHIPYYKKLKFIRHLKKINADFVILDLGAGTSNNVLDLFLAADTGIVLVNPDPLSILEGYNFVKQFLYRRIIREFRQNNGPLEIIKKYATTEIFKSTTTVENLLTEVQDTDGEVGSRLEKILAELCPSLLLNMLVEPDDETNGLAVKVAAKDLLSIELNYLGSVRKDDTVRKSLDAMVPFISYDSKSDASRDLANIIISKILHSGKFEAIRKKYTMHRVKHHWEISKEDVICSVKCIYWEECEYKNGGYPCKLQHLMHIKGFHRE